jgi:general secretion pathway protein D
MMATQLDPTHQIAEQELQKLQRDLAILAGPNGRETLEEMKRRAREAKVKPPILDPRSDEPITLNFPKPKPIKEIYQALGKAYGFNVLFDPKLRDDELTIELTDVTAEQALEIVMQAAGHFYKVLDEGSIIIADDTPQNRREYEDLVIKTFFLSNADVKDVDKLLRSLIEARRLATNEQLNSITLRDTADKVAIAERLITIADKAKAEVLVDVELLQLNKSNVKQFGSMLSAYSSTLAVNGDRLGIGSGEDSSGAWPLDLIDNISVNDLELTTGIPSFIVNYAKSFTEGTTLAQPQLRITEGEKASLVIGDRQPIPTTTFNTANTVGSNVVPITSFQYQDVGIKIDVEPRVHHNREITLTLSVEVSQISGYQEGSGGQRQPIIGTRTINSVIRLKDGETNLLAGLYRVDDTSSTTETPILSDVPLLGRLFTNEDKDRSTTDLVLTLTPHIIRQPDIVEEDLAPLWVGTESRISFFGSSPRVHSGSQAVGPFDSVESTSQRAPSAAEQRRSYSRRGRDDTSSRRAQPLRDTPRPPSGSGMVRPRRQLPSGGGGGRIQDAPDETGPVTGSAPVELTEPMTSSDESVVAPDGSEVRFSADPSVMSFPVGAERQIQILATGATDQLYVPLTLSYDPRRLEVAAVDPAPGVTVVDAHNDPEGGWIDLLLQLEANGSGTRPVATFQVLGRRAGSAPFAFTAGQVRDAEGQELPVSLSGATVYVLDRPEAQRQDE